GVRASRRAPVAAPGRLARRPCALTRPGAGRGIASSRRAGRRASRPPPATRAAKTPYRGSVIDAGAGSWLDDLAGERRVAGRAEAVPQAAYGFDDATAQLAAQVVDVHVEGVAFHVVAEAVDRILQLGAAQHAITVVQQGLQQGLFAT